MLLQWLKYTGAAIGTLLMYEMLLFLYGFFTANRVAHGIGYYRTQAPFYYVTGLAFVLFGLYLQFRH